MIIITIINLDLSRNNKPTDYAFKKETSPPPHIYFRVFENGYTVSLNTFTNLNLKITKSQTGETYNFSTNTTVSIDNERLIRFTLTPELLNDLDSLEIEPTINILNKSTILKKFKLIIYDTLTTEMLGILEAIDSYNRVYAIYLNSIKREQISAPNGIVKLDGNKRVNISQTPRVIINHIDNKILNSEPHGLRLNDYDHTLEYYDDEFWRGVNDGKTYNQYTWGYYRYNTWEEVENMTWCQMGGESCEIHDTLSDYTHEELMQMTHDAMEGLKQE